MIRITTLVNKSLALSTFVSKVRSVRFQERVSPMINFSRLNYTLVSRFGGSEGQCFSDLYFNHGSLSRTILRPDPVQSQPFY